MDNKDEEVGREDSEQGNRSRHPTSGGKSDGPESRTGDMDNINVNREESSNGRSPDGRLSQLERDVLAKSATGASGATRPGAVAVPASSGLSELEREIAGKPQSGSQASAVQSLSQLERDLLSKSSAGSGRGATVPGAQSVVTSQVELDALQKQRIRGSSGPSTALSSLETDVIAKTQASVGRGSRTPGAVAVGPGDRDVAAKSGRESNAHGAAPSGSEGGAASLSRLERDALQKSSVSGQGASKPGAVAVGAGHSLSNLEREVAAKTMPSGANPEAGRALTQLESDVMRKSTEGRSGASKPGVVAVAGGSTQTSDSRLTQLERDVLAKNATVDRVSAAPLQSQPGEPRASLSQLERDVLSKSSGAPRSRASQPGAVSVHSPASSMKPPPSSNSQIAALSQLEMDVLAKSSGDVRQIPGAEGGSALSDLERDVLSKGSAAPERAASRPGAVAVQRPVPFGSLKAPPPSSTGASPPSHFERDALTKSMGQRVGGTAISVGGESSLSQLEQDVLSKTSGGFAVAANSPGAFSVPSGTTAIKGTSAPRAEGEASLSQLERDVLTKSSSPGRASGQQYGAFAVGPPAQNSASLSAGASLSNLERDVIAKSTAGLAVTSERQSASAESTLSQLQQDGLAKASGGSRAQSLTYASRPGEESSLSQLEQDVLAKSGGSGPARQVCGSHQTARSELSALEEDVALKRASGMGLSSASAAVVTARGPSAMASLQSLEEDMAAKTGQVASLRYEEPSALSSIRNLEDAVLEKSQVTGASGTVGYGEVIESGPYRATNDLVYMPDTHQGNPYMQDMPGTRYDPAFAHDRVFHDGGLNQEPGFQPPTFVPDYAGRFIGQERALGDGTHSQDMAYSLEDVALAPTGGIEAFVAENVVDATGVAVIMSEEDELKLIRKKQNKQFFILGISVVVLIIVVVVSVTLTVGSKASQPPPPTEAPSTAPSAMPSMAPTTSNFQSVLAELEAITGSSTVYNRGSAQHQAASWIANDDDYVREQGLTPRDAKFVQRYALAVFYFALGGEQWKVCSRGSPSCSSNPNVVSWLSPKNDCQWKHLSCEDGETLDKLQWCKYMRFD